MSRLVALLTFKVADMQSDKPNFGQPGSTIYKQGYKPTRASGLSAGLQTPQITGSEGETIRVSSEMPNQSSQLQRIYQN